MYLSFYGLAEKPFSQTPDPKFLYWNDAYRETIAALRYGIQERKGFVTMIGEAGTGKTTLLRKLLDDLGPDAVSVFLFNPNASFEEILEYMLSELGIPAASGRKLAMLQRLNDFLLAAFQEGKNTILLIDEAQDLETEVLESLRLLSNLETAKEKILQIVLSGQPELATRLAQPNLRQLKQRIAVRCRLEPLGRHELGTTSQPACRLRGVGPISSRRRRSTRSGSSPAASRVSSTRSATTRCWSATRSAARRSTPR
jgi:general secretion pathway protein A